MSIPMNEEQHLGGMAFILFFLRYGGMGFAFLILAALITLLQSWIIQSTLGTFTLTGAQNTDFGNAVAIGHTLAYIIVACWILSLVLFVFGAIIGWLKYINYSYTMCEFDLKLKRGILSTEEVSIPYRQMQDINVNRTLYYRLLGVSKVIIDSAGNEEAKDENETDIILEPINAETARELRDLLERRIGVQVVESEREADREMASGDRV